MEKEVYFSVYSELNRLYADQNVHVRFYAFARSRFLQIKYYLQYFRSSGVIVDLGCGYGVLANYLSLNLPNNKVIGIDLKKDRIAAAIKTIGNRENINFLVEDAITWNWPRCTGIVMTSFLHHVTPHCQKLILDKVAQSLEKGGVLIIQEVNPAVSPVYKYWASYLSDRVLYPRSRIYYQSTEYWNQVLNQLNFKVEMINTHSNIFAGMIYACTKE